MQLFQLKYFVTVARCRNMSRAADELWISQSALSKAISSLEDELGVRLFDRIGRRIQLNETGRVYYHQVAHVLHLLDSATQFVTQSQQRNESEVKVLFTAATFIATLMRDEFEKLYPNLHMVIKCCYSAEVNDVIDSDFHIYATPADSPEMTPIKLLEENMVLAFGANHPLADQKEINLIDTEPYYYMCLPPQENMHENLLSNCMTSGFSPKIGFCTEDSFAFFGGLGSSSLIAMVPSITAYPALNENLVLRVIKNPPCKRTVYLGYHKDREMSEVCLKFKNFCLDFFEKLEREHSQ